MKKLNIAMIALCLSGSVFAMEGKVTLESGTASAKKNLHGKTITAEETALMWKNYAKPPESSGSSSAIDWSKMPAGSHCGSFIDRSNGTSSRQSCMGYYDICPSGFTYASSGSLGGGGNARISTCIKN